VNLCNDRHGHKLKWLTSLNQKVWEPEVDLTVPPRGQQRSPVDSRYLTPQRLQERNVVTPYLLPQGKANRKGS